MAIVYDDLVQVARSLKAEIDRDRRDFKTFDRMELTHRLRSVSGEDTTRIKQLIGAELERAMGAQGLRCYPSLGETTTGDRIRIFRAGTEAGNLIDAVLLPSPENDRYLGAAISKRKGKWGWDTRTGADATSFEETLDRLLPRERHLEYVRSLDDDPDLATS